MCCSLQIVEAQAKSNPMPEYSNGALEMTLEHGKPDPLNRREGEDLRGVLTITLKNISAEPLTVVTGRPDCDFGIDIRDLSGVVSELTEQGEHLPKTPAERANCPIVTSHIVELEPGKEAVVRWYIRNLFQLEPGKEYTAKVTRLKGLPAATPSGRQLRRELSRAVTVK
jgi:hypothetical protein